MYLGKYIYNRYERGEVLIDWTITPCGVVSNETIEARKKKIVCEIDSSRKIVASGTPARRKVNKKFVLLITKISSFLPRVVMREKNVARV